MSLTANKIDFIIVAHNELPYLKLMLWSLKEHNQDEWNLFEIKVFANNCNDGTKQWCDKHSIWCEDVNLPGVYTTWNYATSITSNPLIICASCDYVFAPDFWKNILKEQQKNPDIYHFTGTCLDNGVMYPHEDNVSVFAWPSPKKMLPTERRWFKRSCGDNWKEFSYKKFLQAIKEIGTEQSIRIYESSFSPFLTTRENYNSIGGFDPLWEYPKPGDLHFLNKMKSMNRKFCIVDAAFWYHFGGKALARRDDIKYNWKKIDEI